MKLIALPLSIVVLACAVAAAAGAQQTPAQSGASTETEEDSDGGGDRRTYTGGRFSLDIAGHNVSLLEKFDGDAEATPAARVVEATPSVAPAPLRPGTIVLAPVADDKEEDED
jgi:hypothetical protein